MMFPNSLHMMAKQQAENDAAYQRKQIGPQHSIVRDHGPRLGCGIEFQMERLAKNVAAAWPRRAAAGCGMGTNVVSLIE